MRALASAQAAAASWQGEREATFRRLCGKLSPVEWFAVRLETPLHVSTVRLLYCWSSVTPMPKSRESTPTVPACVNAATRLTYTMGMAWRAPPPTYNVRDHLNIALLVWGVLPLRVPKAKPRTRQPEARAAGASWALCTASMAPITPYMASGLHTSTSHRPGEPPNAHRWRRTLSGSRGTPKANIALATPKPSRCCRPPPLSAAFRRCPSARYCPPSPAAACHRPPTTANDRQRSPTSADDQPRPTPRTSTTFDDGGGTHARNGWTIRQIRSPPASITARRPTRRTFGRDSQGRVPRRAARAPAPRLRAPPSAPPRAQQACPGSAAARALPRD